LTVKRDKRFLRPPVWITLGGIAAIALATTFVVTRLATTSQARGPITEIGGGGATPPMEALNDDFGLSSARSNCTMCHDVRPSRMDIVSATWAQQPVHFNQFGAAYRDVLFQKVAPGYRNLARRIFGVPLRLKKAAAEWPALRRSDSDGDGYSNELELMFGSMPGRRSSHPARPVAQLERWQAIIVRELGGRQFVRLELDDRRVRRVGRDTDGDGVPNVLEDFVGTDPRSRTSTPLIAARRLAVYRQLLLDAGLSAAKVDGQP
jgi:hypothetical protein